MRISQFADTPITRWSISKLSFCRADTDYELVISNRPIRFFKKKFKNILGINLKLMVHAGIKLMIFALSA